MNLKFSISTLKHIDGVIYAHVDRSDIHANHGVSHVDQSIPNPQIECNLRFNIDNLKQIISNFDQYIDIPDTQPLPELMELQNEEDHTSVFNYMSRVIKRLKELHKYRTAEIYKTTLNSFMRFLDGNDIPLSHITSDLMMSYESFLKRDGIAMNSISFYMRVLRALYNRAIEENIIKGQGTPFKHVYTGIYKTIKRALPLKEIKRIKDLDLVQGDLQFARDMFMFSFYTRGMSFVDIAHLRKKDINNNVLSYRRRKTGQQLNIKCEQHIRDIINRYTLEESQYIFPIINCSRGNEMSQYRYILHKVNSNLKTIAEMSRIQTHLTMYVARHSWGSIAKSLHIPLSVISEGMGHDSETTTQIYLSSLDMTVIDKANSTILKHLE